MNKLCAIIFFFSAAAFSEVASELGKQGEVKLINNETGFVTCAGGTSLPLFSKTCQTLTLYRVAPGGAIKYEGTCLDSNGTTFYLTCDAFNFEYNRKIPLNKQSVR